jgi:uncharacterized protein YbbK (DUF523 family)/uncharacterized protein YbgA (DUF1722 family)
MGPIRLGISTCLLGENVRYDGGHKWDRFLTDTLGQYLEYVPVCPEVECGLPIPRESMHLEGDPNSPRLVTSRTHKDHTAQMVKWAKKRVKPLAREDLYGFIFKSNSPSSGMERVKVYNEKGMPEKKGVGMFARIFMDHFPLVPTEEEGRLHDPVLRENFIERVFTLKRWREGLTGKRNLGNLVDFHTRHKLLVALYGQYETLLMEALKLKTTTRKNTNVLQHMMGYFKKQLSPDEKQELLEVIEQYRQGFIPLIVPITLINHYTRKYTEQYLSKQIYLKPHPLELKLRNHV